MVPAATADIAATGPDIPGAAVVGVEEQVRQSAAAHNYAAQENHGLHMVELLLEAGWEPGT